MFQFSLAHPILGRGFGGGSCRTICSQQRKRAGLGFIATIFLDLLLSRFRIPITFLERRDFFVKKKFIPPLDPKFYLDYSGRCDMYYPDKAVPRPILTG